MSIEIRFVFSAFVNHANLTSLHDIALSVPCETCRLPLHRVARRTAVVLPRIQSLTARIPLHSKVRRPLKCSQF